MRPPVNGAFLTPLDMRDLGDGTHFRLLAPLEYVSKAGVHYIVPAGFVTDLNSSPRFLWRIYPKSNKANRAAVIHDYYYATALISKALADRLYHEASAACGVPGFISWAAYQAVHRFGRGSWEQHADERGPDRDEAA
jgi:hypothetical protein